MKIKEIVHESKDLEEGLWDGIKGAVTGIKQGGISNAKQGFKTGMDTSRHNERVDWIVDQSVTKWNNHLNGLKRADRIDVNNPEEYKQALNNWLTKFGKSETAVTGEPNKLSPVGVKEYIAKNVVQMLADREAGRDDATSTTDTSPPGDNSGPSAIIPVKGGYSTRGMDQNVIVRTQQPLILRYENVNYTLNKSAEWQSDKTKSAESNETIVALLDKNKKIWDNAKEGTSSKQDALTLVPNAAPAAPAVKKPGRWGNPSAGSLGNPNYRPAAK